MANDKANPNVNPDDDPARTTIPAAPMIGAPTTPLAKIRMTVDKEDAGADELPEPIDIQGASATAPTTAPVAPMPEIAKAGVELTKWVLAITTAFIILALVIATVGEYRALSRSQEYSTALVQSLVLRRPEPGAVSGGSAATDTAAQRRRIEAARADSATTQALLAHLVTEQAAVRQFWLSIFQMVLLNVLLPVLTALLGYVFGSSSRSG